MSVTDAHTIDLAVCFVPLCTIQKLLQKAALGLSKQQREARTHTERKFAICHVLLTLHLGEQGFSLPCERLALELRGYACRTEASDLQFCFISAIKTWLERNTRIAALMKPIAGSSVLQMR